ncbi:MAG: polysaccharide biosynthesis tyrosine autokinase [Sphingomonadales bacterium]|nr:polysaccharide biosynthesis tyrosine autokinase [Sphingomonadales bacterium]
MTSASEAAAPRRPFGLSFASGGQDATAQGAAPARQIVDIDQGVRVLMRHRWIVLGAVLLGLIAALVVTLLSTREYRASATMAINSSPTQILGSRNQPVQRFRNDDQYLQTQFGILRSRSLAERVVRKQKLADDPGYVAQSALPAQRQRIATFKLMANVEVVPLRGSDLVMLAVTDVDPNRAARVANGLVDGFIETTTETRYNATAFARDFLQQRLSAAREKLETSERALVLYARNQGIVQLDGNSGGGARANADGPSSSTGDSLSTQSLVSLNAALSVAVADRIAAEQRFRQSVANGASSEMVQDPAVQALRAERARLEADYREKLGTFKPDYPDMLALRARIDQVQSAIGRESGTINTSLRSNYQAAAGREKELRAQVATLRAGVLDLRSRGIGYNFLQRDVDTNRALYDALLQRYKEIGVVGELGESQASVVDTALPPGAPYKPRVLRNLLFGLVAGLLVGLGLAFVIDFIDDTIKTPEDIAAQLNLPALGVVPRMAKGSTVAEELENSKSPLTEGYHSIMTALRFAADGGLPHSILVTSSRPGEGKSSSSLALAQNFARIGTRVLLIDADMRNPSFTSRESETIGLFGLLTSHEKLVDHVVPTRLASMSLLPVGAIPPNPAELLASVRIRELIEEAEKAFDVVIIDAPPVLGLADSPILGSACDATLVVVEAGAARRPVVLGTVGRLQAANARVIGAVLTKYKPKSGSEGYGYGYGYGYGAGRSEHALIDTAGPGGKLPDLGA